MSGLNTSECFYDCPYCGEHVSLVVDPELAEEAFIEDCEVCCRPIEFYFRDDGQTSITLDAQRTG